VTSQATVAKYLSESRSTVSCARSLMVTETGGERDYVSLDSRWRCGSGMTLPHSTQCTLPALCSSSETQSEIRRLCLQIAGGLNGKVCWTGPGFSRFTMHLWDAIRYYYQMCTIVIALYLRYKTQDMGRWAVRDLFPSRSVLVTTPTVSPASSTRSKQIHCSVIGCAAMTIRFVNRLFKVLGPHGLVDFEGGMII
jgi:hypothetical protein